MATWALIYAGDRIGTGITDEQKAALIESFDDILKSGTHGWIRPAIGTPDNNYLEVLFTPGIPVYFGRESESKESSVPRRIW